jgi:hypothetical protein
LAEDQNTFLHSLPPEIFSQVSKCVMHTKSNSTTLEKLGWEPVAPKAPRKVNKEICEFEVGVERFLAMEALFNPKIMDREVQVGIKRFCEF